MTDDDRKKAAIKEACRILGTRGNWAGAGDFFEAYAYDFMELYEATLLETMQPPNRKKALIAAWMEAVKIHPMSLLGVTTAVDAYELAMRSMNPEQPLDAPDKAPEERPCFGDALTDLINRYSLENDSNTPDFILAKYLCVSLDMLANAIEEREKWYGRGVTDE